MNFLEFLLNCNSASFNSNSNWNSRSCFWHQFKFNSNSRIELEFSSHSQFNYELCTSLIPYSTWFLEQPYSGYWKCVNYSLWCV